jgi:TolB protein
MLAKSNDVNGPASLERVDLAGHHQLTYPVEQLRGKFNADYLSTPDGTQLVLGTDSGLNGGGVVEVVSYPGQE